MLMCVNEEPLGSLFLRVVREQCYLQKETIFDPKFVIAVLRSGSVQLEYNHVSNANMNDMYAP